MHFARRGGILSKGEFHEPKQLLASGPAAFAGDSGARRRHRRKVDRFVRHAGRCAELYLRFPGGWRAKLTGTAESQFGKTDIAEGSVKGDAISFVENLNYQGNALKIEYQGKISGQLDPGALQVKPHPVHGEPLTLQELFAALHLAEPGLVDLHAVGETAGQAGIGLLVPGGKPRAVTQLADLPLAEFSLQKRRAHTELAGRGPSGAVIPQVIGVAAVGDEGEAELAPLVGAQAKQLALAVVAAVLRVAGKAGDLQLGRLDEELARADQGGQQSLRLGELRLRVGGGSGGNRADRSGSQGVLGHLQQEGRVDPTEKAISSDPISRRFCWSRWYFSLSDAILIPVR